MIEALYFSEVGLCCLMGTLFVALGAVLLLPIGVKVVAAFPRHTLTGWVLSALAWIWVGVDLYLRPVDLLAFVSPGTTLVIALLMIPASWVLLSNLLPVRALGGLLMLWPMPVILAVRSDPSLWRLVPVVIGYVHLIAGMIFVFHPWTLRVLCEAGVRRPQSVEMVGALYVIVGVLMFFTTLMLTPVAA